MKKQSNRSAAPVKECGNPGCGKMVHVRVRRCDCGYEFPIKSASQTAVAELSEIMVELNDSPEKQQLLASIAFILKHLESITSEIRATPVKLAAIAEAPEEKQLELLRAFNFQKKLKSHIEFIGQENVKSFTSVMSSILKTDE